VQGEGPPSGVSGVSRPFGSSFWSGSSSTELVGATFLLVVNKPSGQVSAGASGRVLPLLVGGWSYEFVVAQCFPSCQDEGDIFFLLRCICGRRMAMLLLLLPRFNTVDTWSLSSVMLLQYRQLNLSQPKCKCQVAARRATGRPSTGMHHNEGP
jgi:hypothetical protein